MTPKERAAMQQALEALDTAYGLAESDWTEQKYNKAITALREALAEQAEQEAVAWRVRGYNQFKTGNPAPWRYVDGVDKPSVNKPDCCDFEPLYAAHVRTKDLTDDEIRAVWLKVIDPDGGDEVMALARAVIAADREKNK